MPATPVSLEIHDSASDMVVVCEREGYDQATGTFSSSLKAWFFGNILVGGVIGVAVDLGDGAAFGYDDKFVLTMKKSVATPSAIPNKEAGQPQS
ncbi:MAG TPA: hypothetical protein VKT70_10030 [Stellaceae bacterium]|nr:hypothetical protein [Stellaceae bacterium]